MSKTSIVLYYLSHSFKQQKWSESFRKSNIISAIKDVKMWKYSFILDFVALPIINKTITARKRNRTLLHHQNVKKDQIARPNADENERSHEIKLKTTRKDNNTKKDTISKHEIEMKDETSSKKLYITKPVNYQNNLDGNLGKQDFARTGNSDTAQIESLKNLL